MSSAAKVSAKVSAELSFDIGSLTSEVRGVSWKRKPASIAGVPMPAHVSVILLSYNRARYLGEAIASVLAQTYPHFELLVWDDGSTDDSVAIAQTFARQDDRIRVVANPTHQGETLARKAAHALTTGDYVGWLDSDDRLAPTALAETVAVLDTEPTVGLVYSGYQIIDAAGRIQGIGRRGTLPYSPERLLLDFITFHFRLMRQTAFDQAGGIDARFDYACDYDLCLRLSEVTEVRHLPRLLYDYRVHPQTMSGQLRLEQILWSKRAIAQALKRRGLSDRLQVAVELAWHPHELVGHFSLQPVGWPAATGRAAVALTLLTLAGLWLTPPAIAQSITPANDGTGTVVTRTGNQIDITGGRRSRDGANLFHSLEEFGLSREQIANFQSNPAIQNILTRVVGGNPSLIDGLLRVTGGNSNLFLLNPAGIVFGPDARLDLPAAFTATTASGIGFDNGWFNAVGDPDYDNLVGTPSNFAFAMAQPGVILNAGQLNVSDGQNLTLLGGTVVNTGTLAAPGGRLTVAAVPGEQRVRLSQAGNLLSLEFEPLNLETAPTEGITTLPFTPLSLPDLLTGGTLTHATGLTVTPDGTVQLVGSGLTVPTAPGSAVVAGTVDAAWSGADARSPEINVLGDRILVSNATLDASAPQGGGSIRIGGETRGQGSLPNARRTLVDANSVVRADALTSGNGGRVIVWANEVTGFYGHLSARGGSLSGNGGFGEVSGATLLFNGSADLTAPNGLLGTFLLDPTNIIISAGPSSPGVDAALPDILAATDFVGQDIVLNAGALEAVVGANIVLEATNDIRIEDGLDLAFPPGFGILPSITFTADADGDGVGAFVMNPANTILTRGRDLTIFGTSIQVGTLDTSSNTSDSGDIRLEIRNGNVLSTITANNLFSRNTLTFGGYGSGDIDLLNPFGSVTVNSLDTRNTTPFGVAGDVRVEADLFSVEGLVPATGSSIVTLSTTPTGTSGTVTITHAGGSANVPFEVGSGSPTGNGTVGEISTGTGSLTTGSFAVLPSDGAAALPPSAAGITLNSRNATPTLLLTRTTPFNVSPGQSVAIAITDLGISINDANGDTTLLRVSSIAPGGTLTQNGVPLSPGDTVDPESDLVYTPDPGLAGVTQNAFTLVASDLANGVPVLTTSGPVPVSVAIAAGPPPVEPPTNPPRPPTRPPTNEPRPDARDLPDPLVDEPGLSLDPPIIGESTGSEITIGASSTIDTAVASIEESFTSEFATYLGLAEPELTSLDEARDIAREIERATGIKPAFVYLNFIPAGTDLLSRTVEAADDDQLELVLVTAKGGLLRRRLPLATRAEVMAIAREFRAEVTNPLRTRSTSYLDSAQQLYNWFVAPLQADLKALEIDNLVFLPEAGLRSLPFAALHDGSQFLVEQFSVGLMPSLSLTDTRYVDVKETQMLGMGISESTQGQSPLPAVPIELTTLVLQVWQGRIFLDNASTLQTLRSAREEQPFGIIHLATHADFNPGPIDESYIQLWNDRLRLDQIKQLGWNDPPVEMLVLSACRTALGNEEAELGFAGLAVQTGVKTAVASLWYVSDAATAALMTRFYESLTTAPIKAEALRQAQVAMARGEVYVDEQGRVQGLGDVAALPLPSESTSDVLGQALSHPYYWAAFTMIGNPW